MARYCLSRAKKCLVEVARFVELAVPGAPPGTAARGRDDGLSARLGQHVEHASLRVVGPVGDECPGLEPWQQRVSAFEVRGLARREVQARRVAEGVHRGVDLGAQPAAAAPEGLARRAPFCAPALCW